MQFTEDESNALKTTITSDSTALPLLEVCCGTKGIKPVLKSDLWENLMLLV